MQRENDASNTENQHKSLCNYAHGDFYIYEQVRRL